MEEMGMRTGGSLSANAGGTRRVNPKRRARNCDEGGEEGASEERGRREEEEGCDDGGVSLGVRTTAGGFSKSRVEGGGEAVECPRRSGVEEEAVVIVEKK